MRYTIEKERWLKRKTFLPSPPRTTKKYRVFLYFPQLITNHIMIWNIPFSYFFNSDGLYPWKDWIFVFWTRIILFYGTGMSNIVRWLTFGDNVRFWLPNGKCIHRSDQFTSVKKCKHEWSLIGRVLCFYFTMLFVEVSPLICFWHCNCLVLSLS